MDIIVTLIQSISDNSSRPTDCWRNIRQLRQNMRRLVNTMGRVGHSRLEKRTIISITEILLILNVHKNYTI